MQRLSLRLSTLLIIMMASVVTARAQDDTTKPTSVDPKLLEWQTARIPKEYTIGDVAITGIKHLDTAIVLSISGLQPGDKFMHPGSDVFAKAIANMWRQKLFANVQIYVTKIQDDKVSIEISVEERPRLGNFKFVGIKKTEAEELQGKIGLTKQTLITENMRRNINEITTKFYRDKGFQNITVRIDEKPDPAFANSNAMTIYVDKGKKVRIDEVNFFENEKIADLKLKKQMKGTKEMSKFTLFPSKYESPYGSSTRPSFKEYLKDWGFLSLSKTKELADPYFRFKLFSSAKFNPVKYEEDKAKVLQYYNSLGYRDAQIIADTQVSKDSKLYVDLKINEGRKYYFGNIAWKGNAKFPDSLLNVVLGIHKGDVYNVEILNKRLGKEMSQEGGDITGYYMDDG